MTNATQHLQLGEPPCTCVLARIIYELSVRTTVSNLFHMCVQLGKNIMAQHTPHCASHSRPKADLIGYFAACYMIRHTFLRKRTTRKREAQPSTEDTCMCTSVCARTYCTRTQCTTYIIHVRVVLSPFSTNHERSVTKILTAIPVSRQETFTVSIHHQM